jgi:hypothetical protein
MTLDRIRLLALARLCAALTLAARRSIADAAGRRGADDSVRAIAAESSEPAWVIPVEIVEAGQPPRRHQVRVGH